MPISAECGDCGKTYRVGDDKAGKKFKCKDCGGVISVPAGDGGDEWDEPVATPRRPAPRAGAKPVKKTPAKGKSGGGMNPAVLIGGIVGVLLLVGGALGYMFLGKNDEGQPAVAANNNANPAVPGAAAPGGGSAPVAAGAVDPLAFVPSDAMGFFLLRPKRMYESPIVKAVPKELLEESTQKIPPNTFGIDLWKIELVTGSLVMPAQNAAGPAPGSPPNAPQGGRQEPTVVSLFRYAEPLNVSDLVQKAKDPQDQISEQTAGTRKYTRIIKMRRDFSGGFTPSTDPNAPPPQPKYVESVRLAVVPLDDRTVLFGNEPAVLKTLDGKQSGAVATRLAGVSLDQDFIIAAIPSMNPQMASMAAMASQGSLPPNAAKQVSEGMSQIKAVVVTADFTGHNLLAVTVEGTDDSTTTQLHTKATDGQTQLKSMFEAMTGEFRAPAAPQMQRDLVAFGDKVIAGLTIAKNGNDVQAVLRNPGGWDQLMATVKPAIEQARNAAKSSQTMNTMKQIGLAFHNFHDAYAALPPLPRPGYENKLSWRVYILPYLEEGALFQQFKLEEPWDSPHNKALIDKMPAIYSSPLVTDKTKTRFVGFAGPQSALGTPSLKIRDMTDGSSNTLLVVEAAPERAVIWTKPEDLPFDPSNPLAALGNVGDRFLALFVDGSVRYLNKTIDPTTFKALVTRNGGEVVTDF